MNRTEIESVVRRQLRKVAPGSDVEHLDADADVRDALDIDSMDVMNFVTALDAELHVDVPSKDYEKILTVRRATDYLAARIPSQLS